MAGLKPGLMDREIVLQTATKTQDTVTRQEILDWNDGETIWAQWLPAGTSEAWRAQQRLGSYINGVYRIYYRAEPLPDVSQIIGHDGRTYDVKPCIEVGRGEGWDVPVVAHGESA